MSDTIEVEALIETSNAPLVSDPSATLTVCVPMFATVQEHVKQADSLLVRNVEDAERAALVLKTMRADLKTVQEAIKPHKEAAQARHRLWTAFEARFVAPMTTAINTVRDRALAYQAAEAKRVEEEQRRIQAEADRKAREERERQEKAAREAREKEAAARQAAEEAQRKAMQAEDEAERKRLLNEAARHGRVAENAAAKAQEREDIATNTVAPVIVIENAAGKIAGLRSRRDWECEVTDLNAFVQAAATNPMLCGYIDVERLQANLKRARQSNPMFNVPGVKFTEKKV